MPAITLAIAMSAKYLRQVRATVLDELSKDYVAGAKARGVKFSVTLWKSIMKASLVTIITIRPFLCILVAQYDETFQLAKLPV